jgi:hypothetical protein
MGRLAGAHSAQRWGHSTERERVAGIETEMGSQLAPSAGGAAVRTSAPGGRWAVVAQLVSNNFGALSNARSVMGSSKTQT